MSETVKFEADDKKGGMTLDELRAFVQRLDGTPGSARLRARVSISKEALQWLSVTTD